MGETTSRGRFITLEGGEGAGKSTQARLLADSLRRRGVDTLVTREPGGSPLAEEIRGALLSGAVAPLGPAAEAIMFSAARIDHLERTIRPALAAGQWVISDRFADSTRAYQGVLVALAPAFMRELERVAVGENRPDLTLVLDLPADIGLERARARSSVADRFEAEGQSFHDGLREAFLAIAREEPDRCVVIDADQEEERVAADIWRAVEDRLLDLDEPDVERLP